MMKKCFIAIFVIGISCSSRDRIFEVLVCSHYSASYAGTVHEKIQREHGVDVQKLIISSLEQDTIVLVLDMEQPILFEKINIGDSILKKENTLELKLKKLDKDTILALRFNNSIYGEEASSYLERIVKNCSNTK
ncbi:MAG: hypothetical protein AAF717_00665 [Bacteroidota bacterium]